MTKFIRVNESMTHGDTKLLLLNADYITHVQQGLNGKDTHIRMHDFKTYYFVKESVQEIWDQINNTMMIMPDGEIVRAGDMYGMG